MAQKNFMGTIGWIKSNLMISSQASEKGYSNENFYPGAPDIPDSAGPVPIAIPGTLSSNGKINDRNILEKGSYQTKRYGIYGSSGSSIAQYISEVTITFKANDGATSAIKLLQNGNSDDQLSLSYDSTSKKYKAKLEIGDTVHYSSPLIETGKWYTITITPIANGLKMVIKQGNTIIESKNCTQSGWQFFAFTIIGINTNMSTSYAQINLSGDKTYVK